MILVLLFHQVGFVYWATTAVLGRLRSCQWDATVLLCSYIALLLYLHWVRFINELSIVDQIRWKFAILSSRIKWTDRCLCLDVPRQLCRGDLYMKIFVAISSPRIELTWCIICIKFELKRYPMPKYWNTEKRRRWIVYYAGEVFAGNTTHCYRIFSTKDVLLRHFNLSLLIAPLCLITWIKHLPHIRWATLIK